MLVGGGVWREGEGGRVWQLADARARSRQWGGMIGRGGYGGVRGDRTQGENVSSSRRRRAWSGRGGRDAPSGLPSRGLPFGDRYVQDYAPGRVPPGRYAGLSLTGGTLLSPPGTLRVSRDRPGARRPRSSWCSCAPCWQRPASCPGWRGMCRDGWVCAADVHAALEVIRTKSRRGGRPDMDPVHCSALPLHLPRRCIFYPHVQ